MSIADKISRLSAAKTAIANAITGKGGTVGSGDGFEDFATDIGTIPTGGNIQTGKTYTVSASGSQTISPASGYDGMDEVALSVPSGNLGEPSIDNSTGVITAQVTGSGWLANNTSKTKQLSTLSATTYNVSSSNQEIAAQKWLTGKQTIRAVTTSNITAGNIKSGVTVKVGDANDAGRIKNITGTYTGSSYTLLGSAEFTVNTSSTTATSVGTIDCGTGAYTSDKIIYIKVRDKAGRRNGYFAGSDVFFMNQNPANNSTSTQTSAVKYQHYITDANLKNGQSNVSASTGYGVYGYSITSAGVVTIRSRYDSSYSLLINGTYKVEVYSLDYAPASDANPYTFTAAT